MRCSGGLRLLLGLGLSVLATRESAAVLSTPITTCNQVVRGTAHLVADLDCTGLYDNSGAVIDGGTLNLAGFTLTGGSDGFSPAVSCVDSCRVFTSVPGGRLIDPSGSIVFTSTGFHVRTPSVTMDGIVIDGLGTGYTGINAYFSHVTLTNVTIQNVAVGVAASRLKMAGSTVTNASLYGVLARLNLRINDSQLVNCTQSVDGAGVVRNTTISGGSGDGISSARIRVIDSVITGKSDDGIENIVSSYGGAVTIVGSDISGNGGNGVLAQGVGGRTTVKESTITNNGGSGIRSVQATLKLTDTSVTGNGLHGAVFGPDIPENCGRLVATGSTLAGNGVDAVCGVSETCADVSTCGVAAKLFNSSCDTSYDTNSGFPGVDWSICTSD